MRQSIGGAWLFSISITLMLFIIAYVTISLDYSNAYQLKNDIVLYLEQYNGLNDNSAAKIVGRMKTKKYSTMIDCSKDYDTTTYYSGAKGKGDPSKYYYALTSYNEGNLRSNFTKSDKTNPRGYVCIYKYMQIENDTKYSGASLTKAFYAVTTTFGFHFPLLGNVFSYRVTGETGTINYPYDGNQYQFN